MYKIRQRGTTEFVSEIISSWTYGHRRPGIVHFVNGWDNPEAKTFKTLEDAEIALAEVSKIEGFHTTIEKYD